MAQQAAEIETEYPHIVRRPGVVGGRPAVRGTRLPVWQLAALWRGGATTSELLEMYPELTAAALHSALAYSWDHQDQIDQEIEAHRGEHVLAALRRNDHLVEERPGTFRHKTAEELGDKPGKELAQP
jgi:uncharacterized protein (DUF433 family)